MTSKTEYAFNMKAVEQIEHEFIVRASGNTIEEAKEEAKRVIQKWFNSPEHLQDDYEVVDKGPQTSKLIPTELQESTAAELDDHFFIDDRMAAILERLEPGSMDWY